ncbi:MAG: hypothetical protein AAB373_06735 [Patescibacteria group bacterium]
MGGLNSFKEGFSSAKCKVMAGLAGLAMGACEPETFQPPADSVDSKDQDQAGEVCQDPTLASLKVLAEAYHRNALVAIENAASIKYLGVGEAKLFTNGDIGPAIFSGGGVTQCAKSNDDAAITCQTLDVVGDINAKKIEVDFPREHVAVSGDIVEYVLEQDEGVGEGYRAIVNRDGAEVKEMVDGQFPAEGKPYPLGSVCDKLAAKIREDAFGGMHVVNNTAISIEQSK